MIRTVCSGSIPNASTLPMQMPMGTDRYSGEIESGRALEEPVSHRSLEESPRPVLEKSATQNSFQ